MSIPGVEYGRRRHTYQSRPLDSSVNTVRQGHRGRSGSPAAPPNNHSQGSCHKHRKNLHSCSPNSSNLERPAVHIIGPQDYTKTEWGSTSLIGNHIFTSRDIIQSEPISRTEPVSVIREQGFGNGRHEAAMAARDRLDKRLRAASLVNRRRTSAPCPDRAQSRSSILFDSDEDGVWNEEEVAEIGTRNRLAASVLSPHDSHSEQSLKPREGLSKPAISALKTVYLVPNENGAAKESGKPIAADSEQEDCPVCLEPFSFGQSIIDLSCKHKFHSNCLTPWLQSHCRCPCCRSKVSDILRF